MKMFCLAYFMMAVLSVSSEASSAAHRLLLQGNKKLAIVDAKGDIEWEMPWGGIHDVHLLENGHIMVQQGRATIVEIDPESKKIVWTYDAGQRNGNAGKKVEVHSFQPLDGGRLMIAESGPGRVIEIDRKGNLLKEILLKLDHPHPHRDTRLVRKLATGNYLVCHEGDGVVREYAGDEGNVIWEYQVPLFNKPRREGHGPEAFGNQVFGAIRRPNGNTLISTGNGHSVLEVTPQKKIAWKLDQHDLPGITLAWVTTLTVLPNGHLVIGNCHAGPENPLLIELDPKTKKVVWTFDQFEVFGNSVSNAQLLDVADGTIR